MEKDNLISELKEDLNILSGDIRDKEVTISHLRDELSAAKDRTSYAP